MDFSDEFENEERLSSTETLLGKKINVRTSYFKKNYQIIESLGSGDFGRVFKCINKFDDMIYAIKIIENRNKEAMEEAQSLASLNLLHGYEYFLRYFSSWIEI